jgi:hypothetical protein
VALAGVYSHLHEEIQAFTPDTTAGLLWTGTSVGGAFQCVPLCLSIPFGLLNPGCLGYLLNTMKMHRKYLCRWGLGMPGEDFRGLNSVLFLGASQQVSGSQTARTPPQLGDLRSVLTSLGLHLWAAQVGCWCSVCLQGEH